MNRHAHRRVLTLVVAGLLAAPVAAGGPRAVNGEGEPLAWDTTGAVTYHVDTGELGSLDNAAAVDLVESAFGRWAAVGVISFNLPVPLTGDINADDDAVANPNHYANFWRKQGDGFSPVIFDDDGAIIDALFGSGARFDVLGVAGLDETITTEPTIDEASIVINGLFYDGLDDATSPPDFPTLTAFESVIVHEIGHFLNLDHSVLNQDLATDDDRNNDIYVPSMYPMAVLNNTALTALNPDDEVALRSIYDSGPVSTRISGSVKLDTDRYFQGAQVVIRDKDNPLLNAYSAISGALYFPCNAGGDCVDDEEAPARGAYSLSHIQPGSYTVCIEQLDRRVSLTNATFVGPLAFPAVIPGPEECSGTTESTAATDDPDAATEFVAGLATADILINQFPSVDLLEPNDTAVDATQLTLNSNRDSLGAVLGPSATDLDQYTFPVVAGQRLRVDIDAVEVDPAPDPVVPLDVVIGLFDPSDNLIAVADDSVDPDSFGFSFDPALDLFVPFSGTARLVVSSFPDLDLDGTDGLSSGPYWMRVEIETICPAGGDSDGDGFCDPVDNCPTEFNPLQGNADGDAFGDACDANPTFQVMTAIPPHESLDVGLSTNVGVIMSQPVNPGSASNGAIYLTRENQKVPTRVRVTSDGLIVLLDPLGPLEADSDYTIHVTPELRDPAGHGAAPFTSTFDTVSTSGIQTAEQVGGDGAGAVIPGDEASGSFGFSVAVVGDVNGDTYADILIGAPGADSGNGKATLVFGGPELQTAVGSGFVALDFVDTGSSPSAPLGERVAGAGDFDHDGLKDLLIAAPKANGGAGVVYLFFGQVGLEQMAPGTVTVNTCVDCVVFTGEAANDFAGSSIGFANLTGPPADDYDDVLIGAPGADPGLLTDAGAVYTIYGEMAPGRDVALGTVGEMGGTPGLVFLGEDDHHRAGASVSRWDGYGTVFDDLLIGAPGATTDDELGNPILNAGYVYAILGGTGTGANLDDTVKPAEFDLARVANGDPGTQVNGVVFLGATASGEIGRSLTGEVDIDGDGVADVIFGGLGQAWLIPGDGPKTLSGGAATGGGSSDPQRPGLPRIIGPFDAADELDGVRYTPGAEGTVGELVVGPTGDVNDDGYDDFIIGAALADPLGRTDGGKAFLVFGGAPLAGPELLLSDIGGTIPGLVVEGAEMDDNLGFSVGGNFDVNGDTVADAVVGAPAADSLTGTPTTPPDAGEVYIISPVAPDEVGELSAGRSAMLELTLAWESVPFATRYNVYRIPLSAMRTDGLAKTSQTTQRECGLLTTSTLDGLDPMPGEVFLYLVSGENLYGEGPLQSTEATTTRVNDSQCSGGS